MGAGILHGRAGHSVASPYTTYKDLYGDLLVPAMFVVPSVMLA
jgi:hypothetical protein